MQKVQYRALPAPVKFAVWLSFVAVWVLLERLVIEPFGIDRFMPFYRIQGFCAWDFLAISIITIVLVRMNAPAPANDP
jgi:hypothetical protein